MPHDSYDTDFYSTTRILKTYFILPQYTIQAFIVPHAYDVNFYFTAQAQKNYFILPRFVILYFKITHIKIHFYLLLCHTDVNKDLYLTTQ